jgi:hypothetical protein
LDDFSVTEFVKSCASSEDPILRMWGGGLIHRRLLKALDISDLAPRLQTALAQELGRQFPFAPGEPPTHFLDTPSDTPYKPYRPDDENPSSLIYIEDASGVQREIGDKSPPIKALQAEYGLQRFYFREELRDQAVRAASQFLERMRK